MRGVRKNPPSHPGRKRSFGGWFLGWDHFWVRRWQRFRAPRGLDRLLDGFMRMGDGWGWLAMAFFLAVLLPRDRFLYLAGQGLCAACVSLPLYWVLKASFRRARPHTLFRRVVPRVAPRDIYSFPSGHTMNNLAIGASLAVHLPVLWPFALAVPVLTGLLRVAFGVHFVSDIAAGTLFGLLAGLSAARLYPLLQGFFA